MTDQPTALAPKPCVLVTGANRGIGLAIAERLASEGYSVAACVRSSSAELDQLIAAGAGDHARFDLDLAEEDSIKACARAALAWAGKPVGLVNCAALAAGSLFSMTRMADMRALFEVNLFGPLLFSQSVVKKMLRAKQGSVVNIASTAGLLADAGTLSYGGSKAALIHATKVMAQELGSFGIRVNAIAPTVVETEMAAQMDPAARAALDARSALPGGIEPGDVADLTVFLLSDHAAKITGQVMRLDRGLPF